jgi:hypothetical protein
MLGILQKSNILRQHNLGSAGAATVGTSVTTGGTSTAKGTPAELIASTSFDSYWVKIVASNIAASAVASDGAMDILIGAATEDILIPDLLFGYCGMNTGTNTPFAKTWDFPLYVPAGSRIACQAASLRTSTAFYVGIILYGGNGSPPFRVGSRVTTYGMGTVPNGTAITPGVTGAEGSWTQITASTSESHFCLVPSFQMTNDGTTNARNYFVDIGTGSATEEEIGESFVYHSSANESLGGPLDTMPVFADIPSGTRLAMRASNNGANDAGYDACIHAVS